MAKRKITTNDIQNIKQTITDRAARARTPLKTVDELRCSGRVTSSCSTCVNHRED